MPTNFARQCIHWQKLLQLDEARFEVIDLCNKMRNADSALLQRIRARRTAWRTARCIVTLCAVTVGKAESAVSRFVFGTRRTRGLPERSRHLVTQAAVGMRGTMAGPCELLDFPCHALTKASAQRRLHTSRIDILVPQRLSGASEDVLVTLEQTTRKGNPAAALPAHTDAKRAAPRCTAWPAST